MPRIPIVSGIKVVKALAKLGYETDHQTGSHIILRHKQYPYQKLTVLFIKNECLFKVCRGKIKTKK
ncbi:MAG: type II toxin-antitoxin system HicA family toxin [Nitrosopumilus sp.]|nr:type II toxin-antitoxin system HicA family toxin [Nitrosopumilus sp.]